MFGRSAKRGYALPLALFLAAFLPGPAAHARTHNFATGSPFGIGFAAGAEKAPQNAFAAGSSTDSSYSHYFLFQPQFDFLNIVVQGYFGWHFYPTMHGTGTDGRGSYVETSSSGNMSYGARLMLSPWLSPKLGGRTYLALGIGQASAKLRNTRSYQTGGATVAGPYTEDISGTGLELQAGLGFEFFALQNYSFRLEGGYSQRNINVFKHKGTNDTAGNVKSPGDEALDQFGRAKGFNQWSPYAQLGFTLNL